MVNFLYLFRRRRVKCYQLINLDLTFSQPLRTAEFALRTADGQPMKNAPISRQHVVFILARLMGTAGRAVGA